MQFVLDDQVGWVEPPAIAEWASLTGLRGAVKANIFLKTIDMAEECSRLADPREAGELVDSGDEEGWEPPIDRLIHGQDRQWPVTLEVACRIDATDFHVPRRDIRWDAGERLRRKWRAAPRTSLQGRWRAFVHAGLVTPHTSNRGSLIGVALFAEPVWRSVGAHP